MANSTVKKGEMFVKEVVARLKGDDAEALAAKIGRKAIAAVTSQVSALESVKVDLEIEVENKEEALKEAMYPTEIFTDNQSYCQRIVDAQTALDLANDALETTEESLEYFKTILKGF